MLEKEILILNAEKVNYVFEDGREMSFNKVNYATKMRTDENFAGLSILTSNLKPETFDKVVNFIGQKVKAQINEVPTKNGAKYVISKINNVIL